jgi:L-alanine-DL-glutamate epimerase-like enolase superfamily enzyme
MKIASVTAFAVKIDREWPHSIGMAASPAPLEPSFLATLGSDGKQSPELDYQWAKTYRTLYSHKIETTLVRIETDGGIVGWGESQSPVAPEITVTLINKLLGPLVMGEDCTMQPAVFSVANKFLVEPIHVSPSHLTVPTGPGLGIDINEAILHDYC